MREISYKGKSYKSLTDLAIEMKTSPANLSYRLKKYGGFEIKKEKKNLRNYIFQILMMKKNLSKR